MSISKDWVGNAQNQKLVLELYRSWDLLTTEQIAEKLETTFHNISPVLRTHMPEKERKTLAKLRYSASKTGGKNPMKGKNGEAHHNWKGECLDGDGYLTKLEDGHRQLVHRLLLAKILGLTELPAHLNVHHIDDDRTNNHPDK